MSSQVFINNMKGLTVPLNVDLDRCTLKRLIQEYANKNGMSENDLQLVFQGKPLNRPETLKLTLEELEIEPNSTLFVTVRLPGGNNIWISIYTINKQSHHMLANTQMTGLDLKNKIYKQLCQSLLPSLMCLKYEDTILQDGNKLISYNIKEKKKMKIVQQKQILSKIPGITITTQSDYWGLEQEAVRMPCGHCAGRDGMTGYVKSQIENYSSQIVCPNSYCKKQWPFQLCKKIGVFTKQETKLFSDTLSINQIKKNTSECPKCQSRAIKNPNVSHNRVRCPICDFGDFCYQCLHPWKKPGFTLCGNQDCNYLKVFLKQSPFDKDMELNDPKNKGQKVKIKIPRHRACPKCQNLIEYEKGCKHMECPKNKGGCGSYFCWVCLKLKNKPCWECGSYNDYCGQVAPTQIIQ